MSRLSSKFKEVIQLIGMNELKRPIFYNVPVGIRFEIGGEEDIYLNDGLDGDFTINPDYVDEALERVNKIYLELPAHPDILRIDVYPDTNNVQEQIQSICKLLELPMPKEQVLSKVHFDDGETIVQLQLYWNLGEIRFKANVLFEEIIKADIGGCSELVSSVFILDSCNAVLFYLYDDRGLDVVASEKRVLLPIYKKYNEWILDYDREKIDKLFKKEV